jgi:predicted Holliday junction resolvase-like endonuclease
MHEAELRVLVVLLVAVALVVLVAHYRLRLRLNDEVHDRLDAWKERELEGALALWRAEAEAEIRKDAVRRSAAVVSGKVGEHLAPYMPGFPYDPRDARFLGAPIDLLVFDGMNDDDLREIVFLEIKTGGAGLTARERRIRDAVVARRVAWRELRLD